MAEVALRLALSVAALWLGFRFLGPIGLVAASPVVGLLLGKVVMQAASGGYRVAREAAYADVQGRYYVYRGVPVAIDEDDDGWRWLLVDDLRHLLPGLPRDPSLRHLEPQRSAADGDGRRLRLRSDALLDWLARAQADEAIRLKNWVEREVHFPSPAARRARARGAVTKPADLG